MRLPLPVHAVQLDEPEVGLVHEIGGLEAVAGALPAQVAGGQSAQLLVDEGKEPCRGPLVPLDVRRQVLGRLVTRQAGLQPGWAR
jgi:hypothetical protein